MSQHLMSHHGIELCLCVGKVATIAAELAPAAPDGPRLGAEQHLGSRLAVIVVVAEEGVALCVGSNDATTPLELFARVSWNGDGDGTDE